MNNNTDITGTVCTDCIMAIVNGDTSGIEDYAGWESGVLQANSTDNGRYRIVHVGEEAHYSTSRCDHCRTSYHGDRHDVVFIDNNTK